MVFYVKSKHKKWIILGLTYINWSITKLRLYHQHAKTDAKIRKLKIKVVDFVSVVHHTNMLAEESE